MHLLTNPYSNPSARILRANLQEKIKEKIWITSDPERIKKYPLIRYGNSGTVYLNENPVEINSPGFIQMASSKLAFSRIMEENNIYSPVYSRDLENIVYPAVIRESLNLSGGRGIHVIHTEEEFFKIWQPPFYWTPFIKTRSEFRAHVLGGKIVKLFKKISTEEETEYPIRNMKAGYHFSLRTSIFPELENCINGLCSVENFDKAFMAVDLGWDAINKKYFIFEINSAPGLNELTADLYASYIYSFLFPEEV